MPVVPDIQRLADGTSDDDDDDDEAPRKKLKPAPGKKTRGRVKIPMEYIKNKLRRYTTFSKRKSNIMKKAYELSTLTGTQVITYQQRRSFEQVCMSVYLNGKVNSRQCEMVDLCELWPLASLTILVMIFGFSVLKTRRDPHQDAKLREPTFSSEHHLLVL